MAQNFGASIGAAAARALHQKTCISAQARDSVNKSAVCRGMVRGIAPGATRE